MTGKDCIFANDYATAHAEWKKLLRPPHAHPLALFLDQQDPGHIVLIQSLRLRH